MASRDQEHIETLSKIFSVVDQWSQRTTTPPGPTIEPGSALFGDNRVTAPYQLSHAVWLSLSHAVDQLECLRDMMTRGKILRPYAPLTTLRAALENAATALWLISPRGRQERVRRRLKLAAADVRDGHEVRELLGQPHPKPLDERLDKIKQLGAAYALDPNDLTGRWSYGRVVRLAGDETTLGGDITVLFWKAASGLTHGRTWATLGLLDREEIRRAADDVLDVKITVSLSGVASTAMATFVVAAEAWRLHDERARCYLTPQAQRRP